MRTKEFLKATGLNAQGLKDLEIKKVLDPQKTTGGREYEIDDVYKVDRFFCERAGLIKDD
jgi:DNA-binding transcriptional MerR regulator